MATTYTSKLKISCRKRHQCAGCGGIYSYQFDRNITGSASTQTGSIANAEKNAARAMADGVDQHACPHCGLFQPEMIAQSRRPGYLWGLWIALIGVPVAAILGGTHVVTTTTSSLFALVCLGVSCGLFLWTSLVNPNHDLDGNLEASLEKSKDGRIEMGKRGQPPLTNDNEDANPADEFGSLTSGLQFGLALSALSVVASVAPTVISLANGWPKNSHCYPEVVGPGDETTIYFDQKVTCVNGMWHGFVTATAVDPLNQDKFLPLNARTKNSNWGQKISGKHINNETKRMWATVTFPAREDLSGTDLALTITVAAEFPVKNGAGFVNTQDKFLQATRVNLAPPYAGTTYFALWWQGLLASGCGTAFAWLIFRKQCDRMQSQKSRVEVLPAGEPPIELR